MTNDSISPLGEPAAIAAAIDQLADLVLICEGPLLRVVGMNAALRAVVDGRAATGRPLRDAFADLVGQLWFEAYEEAYRSGDPVAGQEWRVSFALPDGSYRDLYVNFTISPWRHPDGSMRGVVGTGVDVTATVLARQQAEARASRLEQRYEHAREMITALQRELLPVGLPVLPGVQVAAGYLLAEADTAAGGDWFDAIPLDDGRIALVVGDVVGHGVTAAAVMGQLRAVLRARLDADVPLETCLDELDRFATKIPGAHATTVCVAIMDLDDGGLRYVTAGHPAPLVVGAGGHTRYLVGSGAGPLGTGSAFPVAEDRIGPDELVLLYSDGILERPGRTPAQSSVELARAARDIRTGQVFPGTTLDPATRICRLGLDLLTRRTGHTDDISLLAAHRCAQPRVLQLRVPAAAGALRTVRAELDEWITELGIGDRHRFLLQHGVGELVANSVEHAYRQAPAGDPVEVRVGAALSGTGDVLASVSDGGRWRPADANRAGGRGLAMAAALADRVEIEQAATGTTALFRLRVSRPAELHTAGPRPVGGGEAADHTPFVVARDQGEADRLVVGGPLDLSSAARFRDELLHATRAGTRPVTVDLSAVTLLSSAGVQVLHEAAERSAVHAVPLRLVAPPGGAAHQILILVNLGHLVGQPDVTPP